MMAKRRLRSLAAQLTTLVVVATTLTVGSISSSATVATPSPPLNPVTYTGIALDFIEQQALRRTKIDWPSVRTRAEERAAQAPDIAATYPIISDTLKALGDKHSSFQPPPQADQILRGKANSYGFVATWPQRIVVSLSTGGPAEQAGLVLGDRIDTVQGKSTVGVNGVVAIPSKNGEFPKVLVVVVTRKPRTASPTKLAKPAKPAKRLKIRITLGEVTLVESPKADPITSQQVGNRIGYVELPGLVGTPEDQLAYSQTAHDALRSLELSAPRCGWIIDLRRNRGGYIFPMLAAAGPFLAPPSGAVIAGKVDGNNRFERWIYGGGALRLIRPGESNPTDPLVQITSPFELPQWDVPVAVLTSALTASAAEAVVVSFRNRPNARTFGEPTAGLTTFNVLKSLPDGALVIVTNSMFVDRSGQAYDGPITPDQAVKNNWVNVTDSADPVMKVATEWLSEQAACR